ncbi:hypothetical protein PFMALIP_00785 [Plasmodium falciparum MaliPS096_E11]|uniref:RRM domain-containing protein n=1 Tax=Plasmodium falciparum MaliPS096_E11 TaxID=1036727 RepID=A0A024WW30_PLAFA|nr:hypothetical protein PFMALIP_00785 [Plasmodium falciparum MaliPS096_E11]
MMIENDETLNELHNDEEFCIKEQLSHVDHDEKVHVDSIVKKSECAHNYEQREKRDRSSSVDSKPEIKKICRCHESNCSKSSKYEKSSCGSKNKSGDSLRINECLNNSKNLNEPFKFFIGGIPQYITSKYFEQYGTVQHVVIAQDHETKRNRGFAFVTMASHINKERILRDTHELNGKRVDVREENNTTPSDIQRKIFVGGLNYYWTKDTLESYFSTFGEIDVVQIVLDSSGRSRCFGFVVFSNENSVAKVLKHKRHKIYFPPHIPFMAPFPPCNKETMAQWANFMYNTCGVPFLFNQRFQNLPDFYSNYNYYQNSLENIQQSEYNN